MAKSKTSFKPGKSGNPAGRPKGAKDKRTALRDLLQPHAKDLVKRAVELAKAGDTTALRICLDRLMPPLRAREQTVEIAGLKGSLTEQGEAVLKAMAAGEITPGESATLLQALAAQARVTEVDELEKRVAALEKTHGKQRP